MKTKDDKPAHIWDELIEEYKNDSVIKDAIKYAKSEMDKKDIDPEAIEKELNGYLVFANAKKAEGRKIRPETLDTALDVLHELLHYKDRTCMMWLELHDIHAKSERSYEACKDYLILKQPIQNLRSIELRQAAVDQVLRKLRRRIQSIESLIKSCEMVSKNINQTYQIIDRSIDVVQLMMYKIPDPKFGEKLSGRKTIVRKEEL